MPTAQDQWVLTLGAVNRDTADLLVRRDLVEQVWSSNSGSMGRHPHRLS